MLNCMRRLSLMKKIDLMSSTKHNICKSTAMENSFNKGNLTGLEARLLFRSGKKKREPTTGWAKAVKQANIAMLPKDYAHYFEKFAINNAGCFPILYQSLPGQKDSPLAIDGDITTDLPSYYIWKNGEKDKMVDFVSDIDWKDMVTFYIGCSLSFDDILVQNQIPVRNVEQNTNVSMYRSSQKCHAFGPFQCNMVVSMRPIPEHQLSLVTDITSQMLDVHGAPVHIGNPDGILLPEGKFEDPEFGAFVKSKDGDVPVFWACGVTNHEAMRSAKCPLSLTHCPGMMFITDVPQESYDPLKPDHEKCTVIKYSDKGQRFSTLSVEAEKILKNLENVILDDPGNRGVNDIHVEGDLAKAALALSHASSVALITGFPCHDHNPPDETDGLPGVYSLASMLQAIGIEVTLIVDRNGLEMNADIMKKQVAAGVLQKEIAVVPYLDSSGKELSLIGSDGKRKYDVVLATERAGRTEKMRYYTMRAKDITDKLDPIDNLFESATKRNDILTIGVGDGGNELGMGKVIKNVRKHIPHGETIACTVTADHLITAGTSNWGCYALSTALYVLRRCIIHDRYIRKATGLRVDVENVYGWAVPTVERERKNLEIIESVGIRDGAKPDQKMSVDGLFFSPTHVKKISEMRKITGLES